MNTWYAMERGAILDRAPWLHQAQDDWPGRATYGAPRRAGWYHLFVAALMRFGWFTSRHAACLGTKDRMKTRRMSQIIQPRRGMTLAFTAAAEAALADIPATVVYVWPCCRSGDYLVTLEYGEAVQVGREVITQIEAFMSELYVPPVEATYARPQTLRHLGWFMPRLADSSTRGGR